MVSITQYFMEEWKEYKWYFISSFGSIKNNKWVILKPVKQSNWYLYITMWGKWLRIHRIVCELFLWISKKYVNHKDWDKTNNNIENLEYVTPSENNYHAYRVLKMKHPKWMFGKTGFQNKKWKKVHKIDMSWNILETYWSMRDAAMQNWIQQQWVFLACKWIIKQSGWFKWNYAN